MGNIIINPKQLSRKKRKANKSIIEYFEKSIMDAIEKEFNGGDETLWITIADEKSEFKSVQGFLVESFKDNGWAITNIDLMHYQTPKAIVKFLAEPTAFHSDDDLGDSE